MAQPRAATQQPLPSTPRPAGAVSRLGAVQRGRQRTARRVLIYGDGGLGKTTLAASMRRPLFLDVNAGSAGFDVARYTFDDAGRMKPQNLDELLAALRDIAKNAPGTFDTLAIDVLSDIEPLVHEVVIKRAKVAHINDGILGFNNGVKAAVDEWRRVAADLEAVQAAGLDVVLLDHFDVKKEKNPQGADYGRAMPKIDAHASKFLHTWCDFVFFVEVEAILVSDSLDERKAKKQFATSAGRRLLHARPAAEYLAKSRPELPDPIELPPGGGWAHVLRQIVTARAAGMEGDDLAFVQAALDRAGGDIEKLEKLDNWCVSRNDAPKTGAEAPKSDAPAASQGA
jgi:hypothetical protein